MFNLEDFDQVFAFDPQHSYSQITIDRINQHRNDLGGLFVDRLLKEVVGVKQPAKLYPPRSNKDLRTLHNFIVTSQTFEHQKLPLLYYLLLDCDQSTLRSEHSDAFQKQSFLPTKYQIFMKGLWSLDHEEFDIALQYLAHPSVIPTWPDEILELLVQHAKNDDVTLPLAFYYTVRPTITSSRAMEALYTAIAKASVTEAFYFARDQPEPTQKTMLELLITLVVDSPASESTADRGIELINLPFNSQEEEWFEEFLTTGEGRQMKRARDTLMMRKIGNGKFSEALSMKGSGGRSVGGLSWNVVQDAIQDGLGARSDVQMLS